MLKPSPCPLNGRRITASMSFRCRRWLSMCWRGAQTSTDAITCLAGKRGFAGWGTAKRTLDAVITLTKPWTLHDLRRTVRTGMGALGVLPHVSEAVLNHLPPKLVRTYDRNKYESEKRAALDLWAGHVRVILAKADGANVVRMAQP